jgi:hypothetical protein
MRGRATCRAFTWLAYLKRNRNPLRKISRTGALIECTKPSLRRGSKANPGCNLLLHVLRVDKCNFGKGMEFVYTD